MQIDLWGYGGKFSLQLPSHPLGFVLLGVYFLTLFTLVVYFRGQTQGNRKSSPNTPGYLLVFLLFLTPITNGLLHLHFTIPNGLDFDFGARDSFQPTAALIGAIPWMLAGVYIGGWQAMLVAFVGGLFRAAWSTNSLFTPFHMALQAGFILWLVRRDYDDRIGQALRRPVVSFMFGGLILGVLSTAETFTLVVGDIYDRLNHVLSSFKSILLSEVIELGSVGLLAEFLRYRNKELFPHPRWLRAGPYVRTLTGKILSVFLILGMLASSILLLGNWFLVRSSAEDLVQSQMVQTALEAGSGIPYFIQTGRSFTQRLAEDLHLHDQGSDQLHEQLEEGLTLLPFFNGLVLYDTSGSEITHTETKGWDDDLFSLWLVDAIQAALKGIPGERILPPEANSRAVRFVFLSPIRSSAEIDPIGAIAGWTDVGSNPFLLPTIDRLSEIEPGSAYIIDDIGRIIIHPDPDRVMRQSEIGLENSDQTMRVDGLDGDRQLVHVNSVEGYSWYVVIEQPYSEVDRLTSNLGFQLFVILLILGAMILAAIYAISNRFTKPLERMVGAAESITRGNLAQKIPDAGDDEIGTLASSFERMRATLQDRLDEMDLLLAVSQRVAASLDFSDFLPPILEGLRELTDADIVRLVIAPQPTHIGALEAYQAGADPGNWATLDEQIAILSNERGHFILENPSRAQAVLNVNGLDESINALMAFPIKNEDRYVGSIWLGHQRPHAFSSNEISLGSIIAGQLGVAITNADLYHQAEAERLRLKAVLEATPDAVIVTDHEGSISLANPASEVILRVDWDTARGMPVSDVVLVPEVVDMLLSDEGDSQTKEIDIDEGRVLFVTVTSIESDDLGASGKVCVLWDITHYKKLDSLKSEFVSTVSHDLRMPLTLMRGYVKMLSMVGTTNSQQKDYIQKIMHSADQMARLVDNLLDLGRIEAGLGLKREETDIGEIIEDVINTYRPQAVTKQVSLMVEVDQNMARVMVDPTLLRQAIANLVENAINASQSDDRVRILAIRQGDVLTVQVIDTGLGIAPADQARLFERFYQIRKTEQTGEPRSGLGLAIVKSIVDQHNGRIKVESQLGVGSTFIIEIPLQTD